MRTTIIKTAQPLVFAAIVAASGIALSPFVLEAPAMARGGGGGGDGGGGGGGDAGGGADDTGIYALQRYDFERGGHLARGRRAVAVEPDHGGTACGSHNIRVVYASDGRPMRYFCMPTR
jgi:hypothetical protein